MCKRSNRFIPIPEIELIIDEYKKLKADIDILNINKNNKALLVKGENFEMEFDSIMDTVIYFKNIGIILERKTLNMKINKVKQYKGYLFSYKKLYILYYLNYKSIILNNFY